MSLKNCASRSAISLMTSEMSAKLLGARAVGTADAETVCVDGAAGAFRCGRGLEDVVVVFGGRAACSCRAHAA